MKRAVKCFGRNVQNTDQRICKCSQYKVKSAMCINVTLSQILRLYVNVREHGATKAFN